MARNSAKQFVRGKLPFLIQRDFSMRQLEIFYYLCVVVNSHDGRPDDHLIEIGLHMNQTIVLRRQATKSLNFTPLKESL